MFQELINKEKSIAVVGLGYVGLPLALEFAKKFKVLGFDINEERIKLMQNKLDPSNELPPETFNDSDIYFSSKIEVLRNAHFYIISVPTPIDEYNKPDLKPLISATKTVASVLKKGDYVVYESTVYPGCTEDDCILLLERLSGLKYKDDFKVGYSPERINPGDKEHTLTKILKIVSGCDNEALNLIADVYGSIITAGIYKATSIKVAEAAKIIENTQRDVNIGLMNELSIIFNKLGINTYEVLEAAGTKWNFLKFYPGLVGGHCIGVDPYYLMHKAAHVGYHAQIINSGRYINDSMGGYIAKQAIKKLIAVGAEIRLAKALIMGITFKENVSDIRNSKVIDIFNELRSYGINNIDVTDSHANSSETQREYGISLIGEPNKKYDLIILSVSHKEYLNLTRKDFRKIANEKCVFIDVKGTYRLKNTGLTYWSL
jgi:UDP-N-acetyl-D-glucosamine/UDP-N-acetyl-D-galactosamine dehydrogenase